MTHNADIRRPGDVPHDATQFPDGLGTAGFQDYSNTLGPFQALANVWTTVGNNGLGAQTNKAYTVDGVLETMDAAGRLDFQYLSIGDGLIVRTDLVVASTVNGAHFDIRWNLGTASPYSLENSVGVVHRGAGVAHEFVFLSYLYVGDANTADGFGELQVKCTDAATITNNGSAIQMLVRGIG